MCSPRLIPFKVYKAKPSKLKVAQFTVRFVSKQRFWITNQKGKVTNGDPQQ